MYPRFLAGSYYVSPVDKRTLKELNDKLPEFPDLKAVVPQCHNVMNLVFMYVKSKKIYDIYHIIVEVFQSILANFATLCPIACLYARPILSNHLVAPSPGTDLDVPALRFSLR